MDPDELVKCGSLSAASAERLKRYLTLEEDLEKGRERQQLYKKNRAARPTVLAPAESRPLGRNYFSRIRGSDPRAATCRGKLQSKRSKLNMEINKELMLRSGAENLYKATTNKKLKETVALELSFVNSNLQLLKEQLAELNSSVELYQNGNRDSEMPMVALGLKETKEIDFREPFKDFILEHYSEDGGIYEDAIAEFMDVRQAMRTPARDQTGIDLLFQHFNQLYFVERRFFPPDRSLGIYFEWYDSLTGVPSCQRTVAFEKASVLFNIAALYTQIGSRADRGGARGLDAAVDNFLRAAGAFQYIHENFTNAPSRDLSPATLEMLVHLMCAQARECLFEKAEMWVNEKEKDSNEDSDVDKKKEKKQNDKRVGECLIIGQEAAHVSEVYHKVHGIISDPPVKDYVPYSWVSLAQVKREHYRALSHYYVAMGLLEVSPQGDLSARVTELMQCLYETDEEDDVGEKGGSNVDTLTEIRVPRNHDERRYLGKAHLREALLLHEESMRVNRMCRELRKKNVLQSVLRNAHDQSLNKYASVDEEDDFQEVLDPPSVAPATQYQLSLAFPDPSKHKVGDLFEELGPVAVFNARHFWSAPREVRMRKADRQGFGFSVRGDAPVVVAGVDAGSLAESGGMREGDYIVGINDDDVKRSPHDDVVTLIKDSGHSLKLKVVTPMAAADARERQSSTSRGCGIGVSSTTPASSTNSSRSFSSSSGLGTATTMTDSSKSGGIMNNKNHRPTHHRQRSSSGSGKVRSLYYDESSSSPASSVTSGSGGAGTGRKHAWGIFKKKDHHLTVEGAAVR